MSKFDTSKDALISQEYNKAIRLFTYLKDLCALRSVQVRNVTSYDNVFWFSDVPRHRLCRCLLWNLVDPSTQSTAQQTNIWLEIRKPAIKSPPELPDELEPWIKEEDLPNSSLTEPGFYERIPLSAIQGESEDPDPETTVSIYDHERIFDKLMDYIDKKWKPWASEDRELQQVQKAYNQLFNIYQRQEKLGEQYEVIIGTGLLSWRSPSSGEILRHVLTVQTRIEFDRIKGIMTAGPAIDGPKPTLEYNMLETADRPNPTILTEIEQDTAALDGDPWTAADLENVFKGFVNSLPVTGEYIPSLEHTGGILNRPVIRIAPALILRRRTHRTFEDFYRQIIEQVKEGEQLPENVRRIVEIIDEDPEVATGGEKISTTHTLSDIELYFPLPANEEQKRIAEIIERRRGILVQGPPGTGKSHTICNLIAHFLARGKKILVTSETPRALEVIRHMLHKDMPEIEELCVVWIGAGPESQKALEKSVSGITLRKANWSPSRDNDSIVQYKKQLDEARKEGTKLRHELRANRESDVYKHESVFDCFSGTLQEIAQQVNLEREQFSWFVDKPFRDAIPSVTVDELLKMLQVHIEHTAEVTFQLQYNLFPLEQLIDPGEFTMLVNKELKALKACKNTQEYRLYPGYSHLMELDRSTRNAIFTLGESILATQNSLHKNIYTWAERAAREVSGGQDNIWRLILNATITLVKEVENLTGKYQSLKVTGLKTSDLVTVEQNAKALKNHFEGGKGLGIPGFRNQIVKNGLYLVKEVKVNGAACNKPETLTQLLAWISITTKIASLADLWKSITTPPSGNTGFQCSTYKSMCKPIEEALSIHDKIEEVINLCRDNPGIHLPAWHSQKEVQSFSRAIEAANIEEDLALAKKMFDPLKSSLEVFIGQGNSHPTTQKILDAVNERNGGLYGDMYNVLGNLHRQAGAARDASDIYARFRQCAPETCSKYSKSYSDQEWPARFLKFNDAWTWAKTDRWLTEVCDKGYAKKLQQMLESASVRERDALKHLAALKAWQHCLTNLREKERSALIAWTQAVAKIRGGKGRHAEKYREDARKRLDECRGAIPGWVMPLYQVVQTIQPRKYQFDIAIIDEASQSGPEALLLNYIADKLIVVGDEKQITPMHVGVNRDQVTYLSRKHLWDIPYMEALDLEVSFFSQAELRFPDRVRLREHFRSMPEIIQFSNNLSYANEPLIPLRQYGAHRLEPLRTTFVENGYRRGSSDDIENNPEAEAIVAQIAECCEDPAYAGKTFGVISLMGTRQTEIINRLLLGKDGIGAEEIDKRRLVCGRPYDFQGDERDVIFLSMVDAPQDGLLCRMYRDPDTQRRFNVSASRARDQLWLFHSATLNDLRPECLRYKLLDHCLNPKVLQPEPIGETTVTELRRMALNKHLRQRKPRDVDSSLPFDSWFEVDVFFKIIDRGFRVLPQYEIRDYGYRIDLVVEGLKGRLAVECDGDAWHGPEKYEYDMTRERNLVRCGWIFYRIRGTDFYREPDESLAELWEALDKMKITPWHNWESDKRESDKESALHEEAMAEEPPDDRDEDIEAESYSDTEEHAEEEKYSQYNKKEGRLDRALQYARKMTGRIENTHSQTIQNAIIKSINKCPNQSCTLKSLTSRVLKELGVLTRGNPRLAFEKRVMRNLGVLERKRYVELYQAKNKRVRLIINIGLLDNEH